jgi:hypothetical protein
VINRTMFNLPAREAARVAADHLRTLAAAVTAPVD